MAEIKFSCPHCNQHITCDELWGGHELQCPGCQNNLLVPAPAAPTAAAASTNPLVPAPPKAGASLGISKPQAHATAAHPGAGSANKPIPIRNLAPTVRKKQNPVVKFAVGAAITVALATGGYYGFLWISDYQAKAKARSAEAEKSADGGQVGHIAEVNAVMDATDPAGASGGGGKMPKRQAEGAAPAAADGSTAAAGGATPAENQPLIAPAYTLDLAVARIPDTRANGSITGTNFVVGTARIDAVATAQVLRLVQGNPASPDREVLIYLHLKPGEKLGGQTLAISQDMRGPNVPQVAKRWKTNPKFAPLLRSYSTGYALKLELGQLTETNLTGKLFLALPDTEQSIVAGSFKAVVPTTDPNLQVMPVATPTSPTTPNAGQSAMDWRYGVRR